jgi:16S rRNA (adenine1518-N6/adenine1519-N6)-dimethyltransferase
VLRLRIAPKSKQLGVNEREFIVFCKLAFAQKRKTLVNNLRQRYGDIPVRSALQSADLREDVRAEALSLEQLARVYRLLNER